MTRRPSPREEREIREAVARAGAHRLPRNPSGAVDLSREAIEARRQAEGDGATGRELIAEAGRVMDRAKQLAKIANGRARHSRRAKASRKADEALATAAAQIRIAQVCPLHRSYLHALSLEQIQEIKAGVAAAMNTDAAALAVDTHRRIADQRSRAARGDA